MAFYLKQQANRIDYSIREYVADTDADISNLPIDDAPGSTCFVIEGSRVFMLNNKQEWHEI